MTYSSLQDMIHIHHLWHLPSLNQNHSGYLNLKDSRTEMIPLKSAMSSQITLPGMQTRHWILHHAVIQILSAENHTDARNQLLYVQNSLSSPGRPRGLSPMLLSVVYVTSFGTTVGNSCIETPHSPVSTLLTDSLSNSLPSRSVSDK